MCVLGPGSGLRPLTPGWGVGVCVCLCARSACTPPILAGVCSGGCPCLGSGFGCAPPLLAGVLGCVCVCVRAPLVPRHSWLGCAVWVCVLWLWFWLRPATPGWGVGICVCLCVPSACTPPILAGVCGVGVCAWARVSACAPPLLAGVFGCVCVCVRAPLVPSHSWLGCALWVCVLGLWFRLRPATPFFALNGAFCGWPGLAPPLLAGVLGSVCVCVRTPLVPRHSWLGCAVWVCVFGLRFRLHLAVPALGVGVCVCLFARSAFTPSLLAGVCGPGVCAWAQVLAAPRHSWLGCLCAPSACTPPYLAWFCGVWAACCPASVPVPWLVAGCARCPGLVRQVAVVASHLSVCLGCGRPRASLACLVAPRWCAAPRPVRPFSVLPSAFPDAVVPFPSTGACAPYWAAARGKCRPAENRALCACRWPLPRQRRWARSASHPLGALRWVGPWRVPLASVLGCVRCGGLRVWTRSLTRLVYRTARLSTGDQAGAPGLFGVDADTAPCGSEDATPGSRACVPVRAALGPAGLSGAFWCASPFPVEGIGALFVCSAPSGLGLPCLWLLLFFSFLFFFISFCVPPLSLAVGVFWPGLPWALACCSAPPPPSPPPPFPFSSPSPSGGVSFAYFFFVFCLLSF